MLTAIIAIESGHLDDEVKISSKAASTPGSSMHLVPGQLISLRELVTGLLLRSGNDAAVAISEHLAGSVENFVTPMNHKATCRMRCIVTLLILMALRLLCIIPLLLI